MVKDADTDKKKKAGKKDDKAKQSDEENEEEEKEEGVKPPGVTRAYIFFSTEYVKKIKQEDKELAHKDAMKKAGETWNTLTEKDKKPYADKEDADKKRSVYLN